MNSILYLYGVEKVLVPVGGRVGDDGQVHEGEGVAVTQPVHGPLHLHTPVTTAPALDKSCRWATLVYHSDRRLEL